MNSILMLGGVVFAMACRDSGTAPGVPDPDDHGTLIWEADGASLIAPVVVDTMLVAVHGNRVVAHERRTGRMLWEQPVGNTIARAERLLHTSGVIIVPYHTLYGLDARNGAIRWTYGSSGEVGKLSPAVAGDTVFVANDPLGSVSALDARTGATLWSRSVAMTVYAPVIAGQLVIYPIRVAGEGNDVLLALDRRTGVERWRQSLAGSGAYADDMTMWGAGVSSDGVIVSTVLGRLLAFRLSDGSPLWQTTLSSPNTPRIAGPPLIFDGQIVLSGGPDTLESRSLQDGRLLWKTSLDAVVSRPPTRCGSYLCVSDRLLWILDRTGKIIWTEGDSPGFQFMSAVTVDGEGIMYVHLTLPELRAVVRAFRPPVRLGSSP